MYQNVRIKRLLALFSLQLFVLLLYTFIVWIIGHRTCIIGHLFRVCLVFATKRADVVDELRQLEDQTDPIVKIMEKTEVTNHIQQSRDGRQLFETLAKEFAVRFNVIEGYATCLPTCYSAT